MRLELRDLGCVGHHFNGQGSREECMHLINQRKMKNSSAHPSEDFDRNVRKRCGIKHEIYFKLLLCKDSFSVLHLLIALRFQHTF